jgi:hypothetical protein
MRNLGLALVLSVVAAGCQSVGLARYSRDDTYTRTTPRGQTVRLNGFHHLARDCQNDGRALLRIVSSTSGGSLTSRNEETFPGFRPGSERQHCNGRRRPSTAAYYTPAAGYTGRDRVVFEVFWRDGELWRETYDVDVR